jgi:hypothetical protein
MAIVIEEEKKKNGGGLAAFGWFVVVIIVAIAAYYLFLATPPTVAVPPSAGFVALQPISQISIVPQDIASSTSFQSLRASVPQPATSSPAAVGRANPFIAP